MNFLVRNKLSRQILLPYMYEVPNTHEVLPKARVGPLLRFLGNRPAIVGNMVCTMPRHSFQRGLPCHIPFWEYYQEYRDCKTRKPSWGRLNSLRWRTTDTPTMAAYLRFHNNINNINNNTLVRALNRRVPRAAVPSTSHAKGTGTR